MLIRVEKSSDLEHSTSLCGSYRFEFESYIGIELRTFILLCHT